MRHNTTHDTQEDKTQRGTTLHTRRQDTQHDTTQHDATRHRTRRDTQHDATHNTTRHNATQHDTQHHASLFPVSLRGPPSRSEPKSAHEGKDEGRPGAGPAFTLLGEVCDPPPSPSAGELVVSRPPGESIPLCSETLIFENGPRKKRVGLHFNLQNQANGCRGALFLLTQLNKQSRHLSWPQEAPKRPQEDPKKRQEAPQHSSKTTPRRS